MDIAFLIDGSGSINLSDFKRMKDFVRAVMGQFEGTNTLVKTGPQAWGAGRGGSASGGGSPPGISLGCGLGGPVPGSR